MPINLIKAAAQELKLGQFVMVMGCSGLYLCVSKLEQLLPGLPAVSELIGWADVFLFGVLGAGVLLRLGLLPHSLVKELSEPVALCGAAAMAVGMILLSSVLLGLANSGLQGSVGFFGQGVMFASEVLWCLGAIIELALSLWVMVVYARLLLYQDGSWTHVMPVMFIPAVGNVLVVLSGVALGHETWSWAQFIFGLTLWPVVCALPAHRLRVIGPLPLSALPSWCIALSPPCVVGLALGVLKAPLVWVWVFWGTGLGVICVLIPALWTVRHQPYTASFWAFSFPLGAWVSLSLSLLQSLGFESSSTRGHQSLVGGLLVALGVSLTMAVFVLMGYLSTKTIGQALRFLSRPRHQV